MLALIITTALGYREFMQTCTLRDAICPKKYKIEVDRIVLALMKRLMQI